MVWNGFWVVEGRMLARRFLFVIVSVDTERMQLGTYESAA
jgi:hypothetical protein